MDRSWPLAGRAEERRRIEATLRRTGAPAGVVVGGAAGVGKTRLARTVLGDAGRRGITVRWAAATESARTLPLGAFATLVGRLAGGEPQQLLGEAAAALLGGVVAGSMILGVDDAHLLDEVSALLLHQLVVSRGVTVVLTVRTGEPVSDVLTALWKDAYLDRVDLSPFSQRETATVLETVLGGPVDPATAERLWQLSRGNALFLRELVEADADAGRLRSVDGVWRWSGQPRISASLAEVVAVRMGVLSPAERDVVDLLALVEPLELGTLTGLADPAAVERIEDLGVLTVDVDDGGSPQVRLAHPLYGEALRARMGVVRARRLRGRIVLGLDAARVLHRAVLLMDSDLPAEPELLVAGAQEAARLCDLELAERLGRAALDAGAGFAAQLLVATTFIGLSRFSQAELEMEKLTTLAATDEEVVRAATIRALHLAWTVARPAEANAVLDEAEARVAAQAAGSHLTAIRTVIAAQMGEVDRAVELGTSALAVAGLPAEAVVLAAGGLALGYGVRGQTGAMIENAERAVAASRQASDLAFYGVPLAGFQIISLCLAGFVDRAAAIAGDVHAVIGDMNFGGDISRFMLGEADLARGRLTEALDMLGRARRGLEPYGDAGGWRYICLISWVRALALAGRPAEARAVLPELADKRHPTLALLIPAELLATAWVAAAEGAVSDARTIAEQAAAHAAAHGLVGYEVLAWQSTISFGSGAAAARLAELATRVEGPRAGLAADHAAALARSDVSTLETVSRGWEESGDLVAAADAAAQAAGALRALGRTGSAIHAAGRAHELAQRGGGLCTPALASAARPLPLTDREREIVSMAARGLTNRAIADRLVVSVRTVEGHLYRASEKLGVTGRTELAAVLGIGENLSHPKTRGLGG